MKTHAIIPIFLPHEGCPNDCVFCNQKKITARLLSTSPEDIPAIMAQYLPTLVGRQLSMIELAFFGGSFTGLPMDLQESYLKVAKAYKDQGSIQKIRLSTRPDYIDATILSMLKHYGVDIIELGVQSLNDEVLALSNRGHDSASVYRAAALIKDLGFELGIQLMIGLPGDNYDKSITSAQKTVEIGPTIARIYPTIVLKDTALENLFLKGAYKPLSLSEAVHTAKDMSLILKNAGINVIRIGLKSSDNIADGRSAMGGTFHPAFRQLVESEIAKEQLESQLKAVLNDPKAVSHANIGDDNYYNSKDSQRICSSENIENLDIEVYFYSNKSSFSNMIGNKKSNKDYFEMHYPELVFIYKIDPSLEDGVYKLLAATSSSSAP